MHKSKCLAAALISAIENERDSEESNDFQFHIRAQDNRFFGVAIGYLNDGLQTCQCGEEFWVEFAGPFSTYTEAYAYADVSHGHIYCVDPVTKDVTYTF